LIPYTEENDSKEADKDNKEEDIYKYLLVLYSLHDPFL